MSAKIFIVNKEKLNYFYSWVKDRLILKIVVSDQKFAKSALFSNVTSLSNLKRIFITEDNNLGIRRILDLWHQIGLVKFDVLIFNRIELLNE